MRFQAIIQNLVDEAERNRPDFSEALHARVCEAVRRKAAAAEKPSPGGSARRQPAANALLFGAAVAAILLVAVALGLTWRGLDGLGPAEPVGPGGAAIAQGDGAVSGQSSSRPDGALVAQPTSPERHQPQVPDIFETPETPSVVSADSAHSTTAAGAHETTAEELAAEEAPTVPEITSLVGGGLAQSQWAYLAYDLRLGADFLADQFLYELAEADGP